MATNRELMDEIQLLRKDIGELKKELEKNKIPPTPPFVFIPYNPIPYNPIPYYSIPYNPIQYLPLGPPYITWTTS